MRIKLNLPDWADERGIHILAGIEEVARKVPPDYKWEMKTKRCEKCGICCELAPHPDFQAETGGCKYLKYSEGHKGYMCQLGVLRPYICCVSLGIEACKVRWKTLD